MPRLITDCPTYPALEAEVSRADRAIRPSKTTAEFRGAGSTVTSATSDLLRGVIDFNLAGTQIIIPGVFGQRIEIYQLFLWNQGMQDLTFMNGLNKLTGTLVAFAAASGIFLPYVGEAHFFLDDGAQFAIISTVATQVSGFVLYRTRSS